MSRSPNLLFKHAMSKDYPVHQLFHSRIAEMIDVWTNCGSHIVGGCEWVDYMIHWDTLMISHFSIELPQIPPKPASRHPGPLRLLHAPNHREIKGTRFVERAVRELQEEGLDLELIIVEKVPNEEVRELILACDLIVDQLVIGWYAMFAIEAMASSKPVVCHLRRDLEELYVGAGLLDSFDEIPIIKADLFTFKDVLRRLYGDRSILEDAGARGRNYVQRRHSVEAISQTFSAILQPLIGPPTTAKRSRKDLQA